MSIIRRVLAITKARTLEFVRDKANVAFTVLLPFGLIIGFKFGYADSESVFQVAYVGDKPQFHQEIDEIQYKQYDSQTAQKKLRYQQVDLVIDTPANTVWFNPLSGKSDLLLKVYDPGKLSAYRRAEIRGDSLRYIDWLFPGILAMNIMLACLNGIGYVIVRYRINGVLKRYLATPMNASEFLMAQMLSRFSIVIFVNSILYAGCIWLFNLKAEGSHLLVLLLTVISSFNMMAIGLVMASRTRSEEVAASLLNIVSIPMMFFTGTWFSVQDLSPQLQDIVWFLPMTHMNDAFRAVMLESADMATVMPQISYLIVSGIAIMAFAALIFRWSDA